MRQIPFDNVKLGGFWGARQKLNREVTINSVYDRFSDTGRFDAFKCNWQNGDPNKPHFFWDSDVAKWIESVAYITADKKDERLEKIVDDVVDLIEENADKDGYYNSFYLTLEPYAKFKLRDRHELYCLGHLIEAAVAYDKATGKDKLLRIVCRYADHVKKIFIDEHKVPFYTPGHEEIELALVKLYRHTKDKKYLQMATWFIDERGKHPTEDTVLFGTAKPAYSQDQCPVREMSTAEGHAVRMMNLLCGMADTAVENDDNELFDACRRVFDNIINRRMYITGGIGSSSDGEAFTVDYDLPNLLAYTETCAAISMVFFATRMAAAEPDSKYADTAERALYNGFLSGVSLDGKKFFYSNPLEIYSPFKTRNASLTSSSIKLPASQRVEVFDCSCCPPNVTRMIASLGGILYSAGTDTLFIHHYAKSSAHIELDGKAVSIDQDTLYPADGNVNIKITGACGKMVAVRIPGWCQQYKIETSDKEDISDIKNGYAYIDVTSDEFTITAEFSMPVVLIESSPHVRENAGKVAVMRGPLVYCAEAIDNGDDLFALSLDSSLEGAAVEAADGWLNTLVLKGRRKTAPGGALYMPLSTDTVPVSVRLIPYYAFANRGESNMQVWFRKY